MDDQRLLIAWVLGIVLCLASIGSSARADDAFADLSTRQAIIELTDFIQIPGPNPIIRTGAKGAWDDAYIEAGDAFEDMGVYYFYYHGAGGGESYRIGVATAASPLGPFKKHGDKPILELGKPGSWDDRMTACAMVFKAGDRQYYMWYSAQGSGQPGRGCPTGLATAEHPLGPWTRVDENPILDDFGYIGGAIQVKDKYYLYISYPLNISAEYKDGPLAVAVADKPEGPYVKYAGNPILERGNIGDWDDGGISESEVLYHNGMFHTFFSAGPYLGPGLESIGYAYSFDGFEFFKYGKNPVAARQANPNCAALAETHAIIEMPFIYLYHTHRYEDVNGESHPWIEDLGVQVMVTQSPFSLDMPALARETLAAGTATKLEDASPICLSNIKQLALTAECTYSPNANKPIRVHVRASNDGIKYDTADLYTLDNVLQPGQLARKTFALESNVRFIKVLVENPDSDHAVSDLQITATLGG